MKYPELIELLRDSGARITFSRYCPSGPAERSHLLRRRGGLRQRGQGGTLRRRLQIALGLKLA